MVLDPEFTQHLQDIEVLQGQEAEFECEVLPEHVETKWIFNGKEIVENEKFQSSKSGTLRHLTVKDCQEENSGSIQATIGDKYTSAKLFVRGQ